MSDTDLLYVSRMQVYIQGAICYPSPTLNLSIVGLRYIVSITKTLQMK